MMNVARQRDIIAYICCGRTKESIKAISIYMKPMDDDQLSSRLKRKIFYYSVMEVVLIILLFGFSFFLFNILIN